MRIVTTRGRSVMSGERTGGKSEPTLAPPRPPAPKRPWPATRRRRRKESSPSTRGEPTSETEWTAVSDGRKQRACFGCALPALVRGRHSIARGCIIDSGRSEVSGQKGVVHTLRIPKAKPLRHGPNGPWRGGLVSRMFKAWAVLFLPHAPALAFCFASLQASPSMFRPIQLAPLHGRSPPHPPFGSP